MQKSKARFLPGFKKLKKGSKNNSFSEQIKSILLQTFKQIPIGTTPMHELQLKWKDNKDLEQIKYILQDILQYPSSDMADIHRDSNRLGTFDIFENHDLLSKMIEDDEPQIYCECCGYLLQRGKISVGTSLKSVINVGVSTILYFQTLINLSIMLLALFLIYGIFSLVTNIIAYQKFEGREQIIPNASFLILSLSSKQLNKTEQNMNFYFIQCWLGLVTVIVWFFMFLGIKFFQRNNQILINSKTISAADFSVVIEGVPTTLMKQDLQKQLDIYYYQLTEEQKPKQIDRPFKIAKFNAAIPFYLTIDQFMGSELKKTIQQKNELRKLFIKWIQERQSLLQFKVSQNQRIQAYKRYRKIQEQIQKKYQSIVKRIINQMNKNYNKLPTTSVYITFQSSYAKQLFCRLNTPQDTLQRTKKRFWCCQSQCYFDIKFEEQRFLTNVKRAPQPEDIIWTNIGQTLKQMTLRKIATYSVTAIILGASFVIFFFLSKEQVKNDSDVLLSFVISASITIFNIIIQVVIRLLTQTQREITQTNFQTGLALKSIIAQLINSIVLTFVIKHDIQENIYKTDGLAYVVFSMGITNSFITPLLTIFDMNIILWKIKEWYYKRPDSKIGFNQNQLNLKFTYQEFQVGYQYIYPTNLFLFICFFVSLQPIICIFGIMGLLLMYWIQKYVLFNRCKRPFPGNDTINRALYRIIYFGPLTFSLGNLTWSNLLKEGGPYSAIIPNLISVALSAVFVLVPNKYFFSKLLSQFFEEELIYQDQRIFLPSQYDRLNPATAKQAMVQYYNFLKEYKKRIKGQSQQKVLAIQQMMLLQKQRGQLTKPDIDRIFSTFDLNAIQSVLKKSDKLINYQDQDKKDHKKQQQQNENISAQQNHIIIRENTIEQLRVQKKSRKKKLINSQTLFKQMFFNEKEIFQFVQNWIQKDQKQPQQQMNFLNLFLLNNQKKSQTSILSLNQNKKNNQTVSDQNKINAKPIIQQMINNMSEKHLTYDIIKELFNAHQNRQKIQDQQGHKPSVPQQNMIGQQQQGTRQGLANLIINSGQVHPTGQNQKA